MIDPEDRFRGLPIMTEYIDGRKWRLSHDVAYLLSGGNFANCWTTARIGFVFDWASIPRPLWRLLPPAGDSNQPYGAAALFHDWLYVHQQIEGKDCTRKDADAAFREIMLYVGVSRWRATVMHWAVRLGGWRGWRRNRNEALNGPVRRDPAEAINHPRGWGFVKCQTNAASLSASVLRRRSKRRNR